MSNISSSAVLDTPHIAVVYGDGAGVEVMDAALYVLKEARANITIETVELGASHYAHGVRTGMLESHWQNIRCTRAMLKTAIDTPETDAEEKNIPVNDMLTSTLKLFTCGQLSINHHPLQCIAHIGETYAIFEPDHGALHEEAGQDSADPTAMLHAAIAMLVYLGQSETAERIFKAWKRTADAGAPAGTQAFAEAVAEALWEEDVSEVKTASG